MLSASVAREVVECVGEEASETSRFIHVMNRFFDCINVRSRTEAIRTRNPDRNPYTRVDDPRFEVFLYTILHISDYWGKSLFCRSVSHLS